MSFPSAIPWQVALWGSGTKREVREPLLDSSEPSNLVLSAMAGEAASVPSQSHPIQLDSESSRDNDDSSIIGLWHIRFIVAIKPSRKRSSSGMWAAPKFTTRMLIPRQGTSAWGVEAKASDGTYKLVHRVWNYDASGNFMGTIHLSETRTLGHHGNTHSGSFTLDFYDPSGALLFEVAGSVVGERISVK
jgi:hypothetical protein